MLINHRLELFKKITSSYVIYTYTKKYNYRDKN